MSKALYYYYGFYNVTPPDPEEPANQVDAETIERAAIRLADQLTRAVEKYRRST